ncbi:hypothetical protein WJX72_005861 [[Myrmecia] bisecta]|uniref:Uncharacterized protein n=1 Tax=[Myrmecia] bisecta TaxID=41462 RepID=A0AAW1PLR0_9CHLO
MVPTQQRDRLAMDLWARLPAGRMVVQHLQQPLFVLWATVQLLESRWVAVERERLRLVVKESWRVTQEVAAAAEWGWLRLNWKESLGMTRIAVQQAAAVERG